jgi:serine/threonine protein kinase
MSLAAGTRLDSFEIVAPLGAGGMGEVYRARDATLKRDVAIKVLPEFWSRDPDRLHRFEVEAQAAAALTHPAGRTKAGCDGYDRPAIDRRY